MIKTKPIIKNIIRITLTAGMAFAAGFVLFRYEYITEIGSVDNIVGALPVAFMMTALGGAAALVWMKHSKRNIAVAVILAVIVVAPIALFPVALTGNWWINGRVSDVEAAQPDLTVFEPFSEGSQTAKLSEPSSLTLSGDLPVLDGATALYPIYAAFAECVYGRDAYGAEKPVLFTNTRGAYDAVISGERDIIFVAGPSKAQLDAASTAGVKLELTPIGKEAFVFLVGKNNPTENITTQQIKNIYSGKTARWSTLGWKEGGGIIAFQRPEGSGSQTGLQNLMGDLPIQSPQPLPDASLVGENSLLKQVSVQWQGVQPAIGYSYRYYAVQMYANPDSKLLGVDGVSPTIENIRNGSYPYASAFYAVTNGKPTGNTKALIDWILSPQGQEIIEKTGYTPI